jgi:outer membrane protein OmpA-like peptidoglycan-associated protein
MRLLFLLTMTPFLLFSQTNCDCIDAVEMRKQDSSTVFSLNGSGRLAEITDTDEKSMYYFQKEHNVGWYKFSIKADVLLQFEIQPSNPSDDIDFILFKYDYDGFCDRIKLKKLLPVRTNLARSSGVGNGATGLKPDAVDDFVHSGPGHIFSKSLQAKKGEVYYLVVDNVTGAGGFGIQLEDGFIPIPQKESEVVTNHVEVKTPYRINIIDDATKLPLKGNIDIAGYQIGEPFHIEGASLAHIHLSSSQKVTINCTAEGYMFYTKSIIAQTVAFDAKAVSDTVRYEIRMKKIKIGESIILPNIKFEGDDVAFTLSSRPSLLSLYKFMLDNPSAKIQVNGHVNGPKSRNSGKFKKLSKNRAKAVFDYLLEKSVAQNRVTYKGFGNSKMVYENPVNEKQSEENRRVEIVVLSL